MYKEGHKQSNKQVQADMYICTDVEYTVQKEVDQECEKKKGWPIFSIMP
jgi:hypothetical protein